MTNYDNLKDKPKRFLALTGYTLEEFLALRPYFSNSFFAFVETNTLEGKPRKKRKYTPYSNSCLPTVEDKLLFILIYLRKAMTQDVLGELFGISQPVVNKWIHRLLPILNSALAAAGELPFRESPLHRLRCLANLRQRIRLRCPFMMAPSVRFSVPKPQKRNKRTTAVKRNRIPSRTC